MNKQSQLTETEIINYPPFNKAFIDKVITIRKGLGIPTDGLRLSPYAEDFWEYQKKHEEFEIAVQPYLHKLRNRANLSQRWERNLLEYIISGLMFPLREAARIQGGEQDTFDQPKFNIIPPCSFYGEEKELLLEIYPEKTIKDIEKGWSEIKKLQTQLRKRI